MKYNNYKEQQEDLMLEWKSSFEFKEEGPLGQFVADGIVDFEKYQKILFVLKDPNSGKDDYVYTDRGICDEVVTSRNSGKTWFNVSRWIQALLDGKGYGDIQPMTHDIQHDQMKRAAIMNLKKASGKETVSDVDVVLAASEQKEFLKRQIKLCDPDLVITCGPVVFDILNKIVFSSEETSQLQQIEGMSQYGRTFDFFVDTKTIPVVEYRHPSTGCGAEKSYNDMLRIRNHFSKKNA